MSVAMTLNFNINNQFIWNVKCRFLTYELCHEVAHQLSVPWPRSNRASLLSSLPQ